MEHLRWEWLLRSAARALYCPETTVILLDLAGRALKQCRALGCPHLGEQFLQEAAPSLGSPGRSVAEDAKDSNGDPFGEHQLPASQKTAKPADEGSAEEQLGLTQAEGPVE